MATNVINALLNQMEAPTTVGLTNLGNSAATNIRQGFNQFADVLGKVGEAKKQDAINKLITQTDTTDPYAANRLLFEGISAIPGVSATEALGLSSAAVANSIAKQTYADKLQQREFENAYKAGTLAETATHNRAMESKTTPKGFGAITDDYGVTYIYNKDTGSYQPIRNSQAGSNVVNPKNIGYRTVKDTDSFGVETTKQVPFNKVTGNVVANGVDTGIPVEDGTKMPTVKKEDIQYKDEWGVLANNIKDIENISKQSPGSFGPADYLTGQLGAWMGTPEGLKQQQANAISSNLLAGFGKAQMAGVLTDQDMKIIRQQIPTTFDTPEQVEQKLNFLENYMADKNKAWYDRMEKSNPGFASETTATAPTPLGFKKQYNKETNAYRFVPIGG